jgi:TolB-like protein
MQVSAGYPDVASFGTPPSPSDVRAQLERILASSEFQGQEKRGALLRYIVEESLAGRGDLLKGFTVANAVFGRDVSFDAQSDAVVRLAARRLRTAIDAYYGTTGTLDPLRISIPKGHYRALFEWRKDLYADPHGQVSAEPEPENRVPGSFMRKKALHPHAAHAPRGSRGNRRAIVLLLCCMTAVAGSWSWTMRSPGSTQTRGTAIIVMPFDALGTKADDRFLASGITQELITDLMRFSDLRLYSIPAGFPAVGSADAAVLDNGLGGAYVMSGSVASSNSMIRLGVQLADARTGEILWSETYDREMTPGALLAVRRDLAARVVTVLGQPRGVVGNDMTGRSASGTIPGMPSYGPVRGTRLSAGEVVE